MVIDLSYTVYSKKRWVKEDNYLVPFPFLGYLQLSIELISIGWTSLLISHRRRKSSTFSSVLPYSVQWYSTLHSYCTWSFDVQDVLDSSVPYKILFITSVFRRKSDTNSILTDPLFRRNTYKIIKKEYPLHEEHRFENN